MNAPATAPSFGLEDLLDTLAAASIEIDERGVCVDTTGNAARLTGRGGPFAGARAEDVLPPRLRTLISRAGGHDGADSVRYAVAGRRHDARVSRRDGRVFLLLRDVEDELLALERTLVAKRETETETRFRTMADHAPVLLWMAGTDALCNFFNEGWLRFTGRTLEQETGNGWAEGVHPEDFQRCMHIYLDAFVARVPFTMEYRLRRRDGVYRWIYDQGAPRFDPDGTFAGYIGSCVDITVQREARDALEQLAEELEDRVRERTALARERETLLREVHHRVKNDLQVVASVLRMQGRRIGDDRLSAVLDDCQSRIDTVALIHESMYRSSNIARLSLSDNVKSLAASVFRARNASAGRVTLELEIDDGIALSVDRAVPCGLILHELLGNALKHAYTRGAGGSIRVILRARDGRVTLGVSDDGAGLPEDFEERAGGSLGWTLVSALAEQLGADLVVERGQGTTVRLVFDAAGGVT